MASPDRGLQVALAGLISSAAVAALTVVLGRAAGFQLFTFMACSIIPVGAVLTGFGASLGVYFAAVRLHHRPTRLLFFQMIVTAVVTLALIHYVEYASRTLPDGRHVRDLLTFPTYLNLVLTRTHYTVHSNLNGLDDAGEVGSFGYFLAAVQCLGFAAGGMGVFALLKARPACVKCEAYTTNVRQEQRDAYDQSGMLEYYNKLLACAPGSEEFFALLATEPPTPTTAGGTATTPTTDTTPTTSPTWRLTVQFRKCPVCETEQLRYVVCVATRKGPVDVGELTRRAPLPGGSILRAKAMDSTPTKGG